MRGGAGTGLVQALARIRSDAERQAEAAQLAIERHSFDPYRVFRSKIEEHEALVSVIRARLTGHKEEDEIVEIVAREERLRFELLVRSSLRFFYALSASPFLPIGARETFIGELQSLAVARERLTSPEHSPHLSAGVIDDLDTSRLILEEIAEKAPRLLDFSVEAPPSAQ
jgi:hypothetical protein